jgi:hypothetical protein
VRALFPIFAWALTCALAGAPAAAQQPETVGRIEGTTFTASGQVRVAREPGHNSTTLLSGSEVVVHEGYARLTLTDGSEVDVCGPAKLSLLKSGGAVTLALDYGRIHGRLAPALPITVFTALATATPVSIASNQRDVVVGLEPQGNLCINAVLGAVRLEHQLTGERLLAPQGTELTVPATSLNSITTSPGICRCEAPPQPVTIGVTQEAAEAAAAKRKPAEPRTVAAQPAPQREPAAEPAAPAPPREEPRVIAVMPPLTFDAKNPDPPRPARPEMALLIREVRVQPATVFRGRVEPRPKPAPQQPQARVKETVSTEAVVSSAPEEKPGFGARLKNFFSRLFGGKPKD